MSKPLRVWPGVVAAVLMLLSRYGLKLVVPGFQGFAWGMQGSFIFGIVILLWWLLFSRARWSERLGALAMMVAAASLLISIRHESMGPLWALGYALPVLFTAFVVWAVAARNHGRARAFTMFGTILASTLFWACFRMSGITGDHEALFGWRWFQTVEDRLAAEAGGEAAAQPGASSAETGVVWPGFRGPERDGVVRGVQIATDWSKSPPVELWRRPVGPAWSSFAVGDGLVYTQEQIGEDEVVACFDLLTGTPVWTHKDRARFMESNAGPGPRGTPTLSDGRVYTLGATGILNALDASDGRVAWTRNVATELGAEVPYWGFSSSPLVVDDLVVVAAPGQLVACDRVTGEPRWRGPAGKNGYSSPHLATIDAVRQILLINGGGVTSVDPATGAELWRYKWGGVPIVQPGLTAEGDVLLAVAANSGVRRVAVEHGADGWKAEQRWTSQGLKPYFNDFVVHEGHAYGYDGRILACIDLADGARKWKGGRYGSGQLVLLPDQDLLLVLSEDGELALVQATPDRFTELARAPAIEGKTWNHPVLAGDILLVRNGEEMAAFRLTGSGPES